MAFVRRLPLLIAVLALLSCAEAQESVPPLTDMSSEVAASRAKAQPIVLFFKSRTCPYCRLVEDHYLQGVMAGNKQLPRIRLWAVDIDSDAKLIGPAGENTTPRAYARSQGVYVVPTIRFLGPDGQLLSADLVGTLIPDFYAGYLEDAIRESVEKLQRR